MDRNDIFDELDSDDRTIIKPSAKTQGKKGSVEDRFHGGSDQELRQPLHLGIDAIHTISSIRESGINPLIAAAAPILSLLQRIQLTLEYRNIGELHQRLVSEIQNYETSAQGKLVDRQAILLGRYILCGVLDEVILTTPWGNNSTWANRSLLSTFHKETSAGQKFFLIVEKLLQNSSENINVLELVSVCLLLGYRGKYRIDPDGEQRLKFLQNDLINRISNIRGAVDHNLSPHWQGETTEVPGKRMLIPFWILGAITGALMLAIYTGFNLNLGTKVTPLISDIERIGKQSIEMERRL